MFWSSFRRRLRPPSVALIPGLCVLTLAGVGCSKEAAEAPDPDAVVATFTLGTIHRRDIQAAVENRLGQVTGPISAEQRRQAVRLVVERRVRTAMLLAQARESGYTDREEVGWHLDAAEHHALASDLLAREVGSTTAADAIVAAEVDRRLSSATSAETRSFSHIFLRAPRTDQEASKQAQQRMAEVEDALAAGGDFNELAKRYSDSVMGRSGGRIEWTTFEALNPALADVVFGLPTEGASSEVVTTDDGLHLFRLDGIRRAETLDAGTIAAQVRRELDDEARTAAARARRQEALDRHAVEFSEGLEEVADDEVADESIRVARWQADGKGVDVTLGELRELRRRFIPAGQSVTAGLRWLVENHILAAEAKSRGLSPEQEALVDEARRQALIESYRGTLIDGIDSQPTDQEVEQFYRERSANTPFLTAYVFDLLLMPQIGDDPAAAYRLGETIVAQLREGVAFDALLAAPPSQAVVCRELQGLDLETLGRLSLRLRKVLLNLQDGEVSGATYLAEPISFPENDCSTQHPGVAFLRLRSITPKPLELARPAIEQALVKEKVRAGVGEIQSELIAASKLELLLPEG